MLACRDLLVLVKRRYCMGVECVRDVEREDVGRPVMLFYTPTITKPQTLPNF